MKDQVKTRLESLAWRIGAMFVALALTHLAEIVVNIHISAELKVLIGLLIAEMTKALRNFLEETGGIPENLQLPK